MIQHSNDILHNLLSWGTRPKKASAPPPVLIRMSRRLRATLIIPVLPRCHSFLLQRCVWISVYSLSSHPTCLFGPEAPLCCPSNSLFATIQPSFPISIYPSSPPPSLLPIFVCVICFWRPFWFVLFVCFCFFCWELWFFLASSVITLFSFFVASPLLAACLKLFHEPMHDSNHANFKWFKVWYDFFLFLFKMVIPFWFSDVLFFSPPHLFFRLQTFCPFPPFYYFANVELCGFWFHSNPNIVIGSLTTVMVHFIDCSSVDGCFRLGISLVLCFAILGIRFTTVPKDWSVCFEGLLLTHCVWIHFHSNSVFQ